MNFKAYTIARSKKLNLGYKRTATAARILRHQATLSEDLISGI